MIDKTIETLITTCVTIIIIGGAYLVTWICVKSIWGTMKFQNPFKKRYKWICEYCGDIVKSTTQPYCKECCRIHRSNVKMHRIK